GSMRFFAVLFTTVAPGLLFAPVFGAGPLVAPLAGVALAVVVVDALVGAPKWQVYARPSLILLTGLVAIAATTLSSTVDGRRPGRLFATLGDGAVHGWRRVLDTTWPVRPEPALLVFVPLLVLVCATVATELFRHLRSPLPALLPGVVVIGVAQAYQAIGSVAAVAVGCGYALAVVAVLATNRALPVLMTACAVLFGGAVGLTVDPLAQPPVSLAAAARPAGELTATSPLDRIAGRLSQPDTPVFVTQTDVPVDRWRQTVYTRFDGTKWTDDARYEVLGARLPGHGQDHDHEATIEVRTELGPWLPAREGLRSVEGVHPLVDPETGVLLTPDPTTGLRYTIHWSASDEDDLADASLRPVTLPPPANLPLDLREAAGDGPPTMATALALRDRFAHEYTLVADPAQAPAGHGYRDLRSFLLRTKRGTSEQFATAYVILARAVGLPVRLAVGFRQGTETDESGRHVVRNRDVLAWPEIALAGKGWVAMDLTGERSTSATPSTQPQRTAPSRGQSATTEPTGGIPPVLAALLALPLLWLVGVATAKHVRRRFRRGGTPRETTVGAWRETRDLLRDHGIRATPTMTVRDVQRTIADPALDLTVLAAAVDEALWSPTPPTSSVADKAWNQYTAVRHHLSRRTTRRVKAALSPRSLTPLR
ncbi:DUF3488 and transglutaminase-like domain-containing protein, partial [Actinophytocola sp.]|uniref:DUF3488 and transglutaminase-like domain-containing protein n=1 Tax=Actinophytocola sp. TaxID=1872138 RepID=UPI002D2C0011